MNYKTLVQAISQQGITSNLNMKLKSPTLEKNISNMMEASNTPTKRETWAQQVSADEHTRFSVLTPLGIIKYIRAVVLLTDPATDEITAVGCSGDGITMGPLVKFDPAMLTAVTLSIATGDDTTKMKLEAVDVTPTDFKDKVDPEKALTNDLLGHTEAVNMVVTPVMWPYHQRTLLPKDSTCRRITQRLLHAKAKTANGKILSRCVEP